MKRILIYVIILFALVLVPVKGNDVGKLEPVQTVAVYMRDGAYWIETDTDDKGHGATLRQAFDNLVDSTPAIIYLDTADFLLIEAAALDQIGVLRGVLKDSVTIYLLEGIPNLPDVSKFLSIHGAGPKLKSWEKGSVLPVLRCINGQIILG